MPAKNKYYDEIRAKTITLCNNDMSSVLDCIGEELIERIFDDCLREYFENSYSSLATIGDLHLGEGDVFRVADFETPNYYNARQEPMLYRRESLNEI